MPRSSIRSSTSRADSAEPEAQPHAVGNHLHRVAVALVRRQQGIHGQVLPRDGQPLDHLTEPTQRDSAPGPLRLRCMATAGDPELEEPFTGLVGDVVGAPAPSPLARTHLSRGAGSTGGIRRGSGDAYTP